LTIFGGSLKVHLQQGDEQHQRADGVHQPAVVGEQRLAAPPFPHVQILGVVVVAVVRRVVGHLPLDAGPGGAGVAAAEGHAVHQVLAVHVAPDAAGRGKRAEVRGQVMQSSEFRV